MCARASERYFSRKRYNYKDSGNFQTSFKPGHQNFWSARIFREVKRNEIIYDRTAHNWFKQFQSGYFAF